MFTVRKLKLISNSVYALIPNLFNQKYVCIYMYKKRPTGLYRKMLILIIAE